MFFQDDEDQDDDDSSDTDDFDADDDDDEDDMDTDPLIEELANDENQENGDGTNSPTDEEVRDYTQNSHIQRHLHLLGCSPS